MDPLAFPPHAPSGHAPSGLVPARDFRTMIDQVAFSAATQMSRPVRTGVLVTADDEALVLSPQPMATGSLSTASTSALKAGPAPPGTALSLLIPAKTVIEIARLLVSGEVRLEISVNRGSSQVLFHVEAPTGGQVTVIGTRFLEGVFPDLERVIPSEPATEVTASRAELVTAIALEIFPEGAPDDGADGPRPVAPGEQSLGSTEPGDVDDAEGDAMGALGLDELDVFLDVGVSAGDQRRQPVLRISAQAQAQEIGNNAARIPVTVSGAAMSVPLSSQFLGDVLSALRCELVILNFTSPTSPVVVRGMGVDGYTHVIMPMHAAR
jgi:DNA polymerase III subunit beta